MKIDNSAVLVLHGQTSVANLRGALSAIDGSDLTDASSLRIIVVNAGEGVELSPGVGIRAEDLPPEGLLYLGQIDI